MTWPTSRPGHSCCSTPGASCPATRFTRCSRLVSADRKAGWFLPTGRRAVVRVVVCTVVHHPADARIYFRQIRALLEAGHQVTYIAPFGEPGAPVPDSPDFDHPPGEARQPGGSGARGEGGREPPIPEDRPPELAEPERTGPSLTTVTIPRAVGRRRLSALRAAKAAMAEHAPDADLLLVHDPELLLVLPPRRKRPPTVWDVHEDTAAALTTKAWLPSFVRPVAAGGVAFAERLAERRLHLILAEHGYNARFRRTHPVV